MVGAELDRADRVQYADPADGVERGSASPCAAERQSDGRAARGGTQIRGSAVGTRATRRAARCRPPHRRSKHVDTKLAGKTVLVTGGAKGIGRAIARAFAAEKANVVVADIDGKAAGETAAELRAAGGSAEGVQLDVTKRADVFAAVGKIVERTGGIDVLINNAGIVALAKIEEITEAE
ncbi:MAG: SDR family NAD(P)-dependent oxidoreductase, partial [Alphaproteobacteria bacterium]|nr:SDR family NAD(P)-dependent oxidoreductase [Alphaproteobacteria bacterium]